MLVIGGSVVARLHGSRPAGPGRLIARETEALWRSPERSGPDGPDDAVATFELVNTGGAPVRIRGVETSCGCTEASVQPKMIEPGQVGIVKVKATSIPVGERAVTVGLQTDSPLTPHVGLLLRVIGSRRPPFLMTAFGDLTYLDAPLAEGPREITAISVESKGASTGQPTLETDLPFLVFSRPTVDEKPYFDPRTVQRSYVYKVSFAPPGPPKSLFSGEVRVVDPWDPEHKERIPVSGQTVPALRVVPSRLVLRARASTSERAKATFSVLSKEPAPDLVVGFDGKEEAPFEVQRDRVSDDGRLSVYSIRLTAEKPLRATEFALLVYRTSSAAERVVVPVLVRWEDQP